MARNRNKGNRGTAQTTNNDNNDTTGGLRMPGLTPEQIKALLGKTRQKGVYEDYLIAFVASGEGGVCANEEWVDLSDKKATTLKQGFENAKEKARVVEETAGASKNIKVISNEDKVFLINLANVEAAEVAA